MHAQPLAHRIDNPVMGHRVPLVGVELRPEIVQRLRWREDLADPIRPNPNRRPARTLGNAVAAPAGKIWAEDLVRLQLDLHLTRDPPTAGTTTPEAAVERIHARRELRLSSPMLKRRARLPHELAVDHLMEPLILRDREQLGSSGQPAGDEGHAAEDTPRAGKG